MHPYKIDKVGALTFFISMEKIKECLPEDSCDLTQFTIQVSDDRVWINGKLIIDMNADGGIWVG